MMKRIEFKTIINTDIEYKNGLEDFYDFVMSLKKKQLQDLILWDGKTFVTYEYDDES